MNPASSEVTVRPARPGDEDVICRFVHDLASFEKEPEHCHADPGSMREHLFGDRPACEAAVAEIADEPVGMMVWFTTYSTWKCRPGIWLDDLYVRPEHRRRGAGLAMLRHLANVAAERGAGRLEWSVLDWNAPAVAFYEKIGSQLLRTWRICRMEADEIAALAQGSRP